MDSDPTPLARARRQSVAGVFYAAGAFLTWGFSPIYWKAMQAVPAFEIVSHRVVWSFLFLAVLVGLQGRWPEFRSAVGSWRTLLVLGLTTLLVSANWVLYIWAVNAGYILQASLGYYINPLVNVLLGMVFLKERLRRPQVLAVLLACTAVVVRGVSFGQFPWIALTLGITFGLYGLIRKIAPVGSLVGLTLETLLLAPISLAFLVHLELQGSAALLHVGGWLDALLIGTGVFTAVPLLFFNLGARRINLSTLGLMQYLAPSGMFLLAVFAYGEPFSAMQGWTFGLIWTALAIYSIDSLRAFRRAATP
ncbi:MAG: EamA family transporter RarD [Desulfobacteraceae bacterium]|nr:MAG: EamA family transporter RarD [Desulfobacteraceae bacterium]